MVRDGASRLLTMRGWNLSVETDLILRSPPEAGISKDGRDGAATPVVNPVREPADSRLTRRHPG